MAIQESINAAEVPSGQATEPASERGPSASRRPPEFWRVFRRLQWMRSVLGGLLIAVLTALIVTCLGWAGGLRVSAAVLPLGVLSVLSSLVVWHFPARPQRVLLGFDLGVIAAMLAWSYSQAVFPVTALAALTVIWVGCFPTRSAPLLKWFGRAVWAAWLACWALSVFGVAVELAWWTLPLFGICLVLSARAHSLIEFGAYQSVGGQVDEVLADAGDVRRFGFDANVAMIGVVMVGVFVVFVWTRSAAEADQRARSGVILIGGS